MTFPRSHPVEPDPSQRVAVRLIPLSRSIGCSVTDLLTISGEALARYKLRTALSTLGVVLGVSAVIAMMSVSDGARVEALRQVEQLGLNNVIVRNTVGANGASISLKQDNLKEHAPAMFSWRAASRCRAATGLISRSERNASNGSALARREKI